MNTQDRLPVAGSGERIPTAELDPDDFKAAFRYHPAGVALISANSEGRLAAITATSLASLSAVPPLCTFSISDLSSNAPVFRAASSVVLHLLDASNLDLARLGAASGADRFADERQWSLLATGEPVFRGTRWLRSRVIERVRAGSATLFVVEALEIGGGRKEGPASGLVYLARTWHRVDDASILD